MPGKEKNIITRDPDEQMKGYLIYGAKAGAVAGAATAAVVLGAQRYSKRSVWPLIILISFY